MKEEKACDHNNRCGKVFEKNPVPIHKQTNKQTALNNEKQKAFP